MRSDFKHVIENSRDRGSSVHPAIICLNKQLPSGSAKIDRCTLADARWQKSLDRAIFEASGSDLSPL
ncbi:MAG: hypothetical protein DWH79_11915 [Planctomycetota bacterium]|nr:MAG: hypothetical protein DWH79_11915 [Planctomycetota bacterium]